MTKINSFTQILRAKHRGSYQPAGLDFVYPKERAKIIRPLPQELRDQIIRENMALVGHYTSRFLWPRASDGKSTIPRKLPIGAEPNDVFEAGILGLIHAVDHFDPSLGYRFSTFASVCILGFMFRVMRNWDRHQYNYWRATGHSVRFVSLNHDAPEEYDPFSAPSSMKNTYPEDEHALEMLQEAVNQIDVKGIGIYVEEDRLVRILESYFLEDQTLEDIGAAMNLTRERIRQLRNKAISQIRRALKIKVE